LSDKQVNFISGSTISGSDNVTFDYTTNTLSASNLQGDGSGITGVVASASPGGANKDIQFNNSGSTSGSANFTFDKTTNIVTVTGDLTASANISASAFYGDGSNLTGISGGSGSPGGLNTQVQFNDAGAFGASADLTYNDTTNTLAVTGTLVATGSGTGYIFSLSGSTIDSSFGGGLIQSKYALKTNDDILIDAGDVAGVDGDITLLAKTGQVIAAGGNQTDILAINSLGGVVGSVNTIQTLDGAGIDVHSANALSLSGSAITVTGPLDVQAGATGDILLVAGSSAELTADSTVAITSNNDVVEISANGVGATINLNSNVNATTNITASGHVSASTYYGDGSNLSGVGGGSAAGSDTYIQFNDGGTSFGGEANFTFNKTTDVFNVSGSTRITGALDQGNDTAENYFRLSSHADRLDISEAFYSGETYYPKSGNPAVSTTAGGLYYLTSTDEQLAFTASVTTSGAEALPVIALGPSSSYGYLVRGWFRYQGAMSASISSSATDMEFEMAKQVYASSITPGYLTTVQPTGSGDVVRVMGNSVGSWLFYFNPSPDFVTV
jgi:hypothetical protein